MVDIKPLTRFLYKTYVRSLEHNPLSRAEKMVVSWVATVLVLRYLVNCLFSVYWLRNGMHGFGEKIMLFNLMYIFLFWLILPFLLSGMKPSGQCYSLNRLLCLPIPRISLFGLVLLNIIFRPVYGILFTLTLVGLLPLLLSGYAWYVILLGVVYALFCLMISICISMLGESVYQKGIIRTVMRLAVPLTVLFTMALNARFLIHDLRLYLVTGIGRFLWHDAGTGMGPAPAFGMWSPAGWVFGGPAAGALSVRVGLLLFCLLASFGLAWLLFLGRIAAERRGLSTVRTGPKKSVRFKRFTGKTILLGMRLKESLYAFRSGDFWLGLFLSIWFSADILLGRNMTPRILFPLPPMLLLLNTAAVYNCFGLDGVAFSRYAILPIRLQSVFRVKNASYLFVTGMHLVPVLISAWIRFGGTSVLPVMSNCIIIVIYSFISGNFLSLYMPVPRRWHAFITGSQSGGIFALAITIGGWIGLSSLDERYVGVVPLIIKAIMIIFLIIVYTRLLRVWERIARERSFRLMRDLSA